jgi:DNA-binding transcriptional regulator GbsR (MarR family)
MIFVALWFDPRISYIQRDIIDNRDYIKAVDASGTRKSQQEVEGLTTRMTDNTRRIEQLEARYTNIDEALKQILQRMAAGKQHD